MADSLFAQFIDVELIRMDSFFIPLTQQQELSANENLSQNIPHLRWTEVEQCVRKLRLGKDVLYRPYLWDEDKLGDETIIHAHQVIIIEGLYALHTRLQDVYNFKIWVDTQFDNRMQRVEMRDGKKLLSLWHNLYVPREVKYIATQKPHDVADIFVLGINLEWSCTDKGFSRRCVA